MLRIRLNGKSQDRFGQGFIAGLVAFLLLCASVTTGWCDPVALGTARTVAYNKIQQHLALYGRWNESETPVLLDGQRIEQEGALVAYNFNVSPGGHILVAADDAFSPILLYSTRSTLDPDRQADPNSVESWILPELYHNTLRMDAMRTEADNTMRSATVDAPGSKIRRAWQFLAQEPSSADPARNQAYIRENTLRTATAVGPLLPTTWSQGSPYNLQTPADGSCSHTVTGCVATAWAQLARYWKWPIQGNGSHSYSWNSQTLSANFGATVYDWDAMPAQLTGSSSQAQKDAVSLLMYHMGVAAEMKYGCSGSSSSVWADDALDLYFRYKSAMQLHYRGYYTANQWLALYKTEFDADPARPIVMSMLSTDESSGHKVVADGYQDDATMLIHLNMGWDGYQDAFYNVTSNFQTDVYTWDANQQWLVTGIEPDNTPPVVDAGPDQRVEARTEVHLNGSAVDPEGVGIRSRQWSQTGGPAVSLSDTASSTPFFTAPEVAVETDFTFQLRADDENRAFATDTVIITVFPAADAVIGTIAAATQGNGSVSLDPAGGIYLQDSIVTATAVADEDYQFDHWEGDASGSTNPLSLTVNGDKTITAVFVEQPGDSVTFDTSQGYNIKLHTDAGTMAVEAWQGEIPDGLLFHFDPMDITISGLTAGSAVTLTIDLPFAALNNAGMYALLAGAWADADAISQFENSRMRVVIRITDGGNWDQDQTADGKLVISLGLGSHFQTSSDGSDHKGSGGGGSGCFISSLK